MNPFCHLILLIDRALFLANPVVTLKWSILRTWILTLKKQEKNHPKVVLNTYYLKLNNWIVKLTKYFSFSEFECKQAARYCFTVNSFRWHPNRVVGLSKNSINRTIKIRSTINWKVMVRHIYYDFFLTNRQQRPLYKYMYAYV